MHFEKKLKDLEVGKRGERVAEKYLEKEGYCVLERNYKNKYSEIDLIVKKGKELVFVEVRSKTEENFGSPEETVKEKKKRKLRQNALAYTSFNNYDGPYRIDLVCVVFDKEENISRITHYKNIDN
jgi:putative endonuclease